MTVNNKIFGVSTLNTIEYGPSTLNIKPHLDPLTSRSNNLLSGPAIQQLVNKL
jgi:hypothetical protein